ncbi:MAG: TQO small subunit DoxD [bacterium]|nr:TQO small subunit DoxD [bacterium]
MDASPRSGPPAIGLMALSFFRIVIGLMWIDMALQKAPWKGEEFGWLYGWIWKEINHPTFGWYKAFLENFVLPNFTFFGYMTFVTEMFIGLSLLTGTVVVLGSLAGFVMQVNIALGSFSVPGEWYWIWPLQILPHLVFMAARAGRFWGVDGLVRPKLAERPGLVGLAARWIM